MILVITTLDELDRAGAWTAQAVLELRRAEAPVTVHCRGGCPVPGCGRTDEHPHRHAAWKAVLDALDDDEGARP